MQQSELGRQYQASATPGESPRTRDMALVDAYFHGCQYDGLPRAWHETVDAAGQLIPFRARRPSTILPIPRLIVRVYVRSLWGAGRRPKATLAGGTPEDNALLDDMIAEARLLRVMTEATRRGLTIGTGLVVWRLEAGRLRADAWDAKFADPTFKPGAFPELEALDYRYQFTREIRDPMTGQMRPTKFWHRETIDATTWTVYEDVEVSVATEPTWKAQTSLPHGLGFVPAVWFTVGERGVHDFDGTGVFAPHVGLIDEINYTASQLGRALYYNLDPQTVVSGVDEADIGDLLKSGWKTWCLPEKADAKLLESNGAYIEQGHRRIDDLKKAIFDATGIVLPDPERVTGAQSGASLELLAAPQIAEVDALREEVGDAYTRVLEQILGAMASPAMAPEKTRINVRDRKKQPKPATPASTRIVLSWGAHFPVTPSDAQIAADAVNKATTAGTLSKAAGARYLAKYFGVEDVEADQDLVEADEDRADQRLRDVDARSAYYAGVDHLPDHLDVDENSGKVVRAGKASQGKGAGAG